MPQEIHLESSKRWDANADAILNHYVQIRNSYFRE
jgi:hypothetical protein